jgi:hypothetical protein
MSAASDRAPANALFRKSVLAWRENYLTAKAEIARVLSTDAPAAEAAPTPRPKIVRPGPRHPRRRVK